MPAVHLDAKTISWLGKPLAPDTAYAVCENDIRRWAIATFYPEEAPVEFLDDAAARRGPWGGMVAPRDFNPFAWTRCTPPDTYPWMRGMGTEPGRRGLNGGQRNSYFAPIRPGDSYQPAAFHERIRPTPHSSSIVLATRSATPFGSAPSELPSR